MEILTVPIRLFADADAPLPAEHALNLGLQRYRLVKESLFF